MGDMDVQRGNSQEIITSSDQKTNKVQEEKKGKGLIKGRGVSKLTHADKQKPGSVANNQLSKGSGLIAKGKSAIKAAKNATKEHWSEVRSFLSLSKPKAAPPLANSTPTHRGTKTAADKVSAKKEVRTTEKQAVKPPTNFAQFHRDAETLINKANDIMAKPNFIRNEPKEAAIARQVQENNDKVTLAMQLSSLRAELTSQIRELSLSRAGDKTTTDSELKPLNALQKQIYEKVVELSDSQIEAGGEPNKKERPIADFPQLNQEARDLIAKADDLMARPKVIRNESKGATKARQTQDNKDKLAVAKQLSDLHSDVTSRISQLIASPSSDKAVTKRELDQLFALRKRLDDRMTRIMNSQVTIR